MNRFYKILTPLVILSLLLFVSPKLVRATTTSFTTSQTWTAPAGVCVVDVQVWGDGGGGGNGATGRGGGGAGGGAYSENTALVVVPGTVYTVTVGQGGAAITNGIGSMFQSSTTVFAAGGTAGGTGASGTGGSAGLSANGFPTSGGVLFSGGTGGTGGAGGSLFRGGGGGGGAGTANGGGIGGNSTNSAGGTVGTGGATGGGNGGAGSASATGGLGSTLGGGGGGAGDVAGQVGGQGARGEVDLIFNTGTCTASTIPSKVQINAPVYINSRVDFE